MMRIRMKDHKTKHEEDAIIFVNKFAIKLNWKNNNLLR